MSDKVFQIQPIPTMYNDVKFRSRVEARWAVFFDAAGLRYQYEPDGFVVFEGGYLPDFWLPDVKMFFEVKGVDPDMEEMVKCAALCRRAECDVLLAVGAPEERFQMLWFHRGDAREGRYVFAHDRYAAAGFWLLSEEGGQCIGPATTMPGGALFFTMQPAYEAARSERFDAHLRHARVQPVAFPADAHEHAA